MRKFFSATLCFLAVAAVVSAQTVTLPAEVKGDKGGIITVTPTAVDGGALKWRFDKKALQALDLSKLEFAASKNNSIVFFARAEGKFTVEAWCAKGNAVSEIATTTVIVGPEVRPVGEAPKPDGDKEAAKKKEDADKEAAKKKEDADKEAAKKKEDADKEAAKQKEDAKPTPPPIDGEGFKVLIVFDEKDKRVNTNIPLPVREYLDENTVKDAKGKAEWIVLNKGDDVSRIESPQWRKTMTQTPPPKSYPWIIISTGNGRTSYQGPLPSKGKDIIELLDKVKKLQFTAPPLEKDKPTPRIDLSPRILWWEQNFPQYSSKP